MSANPNEILSKKQLLLLERLPQDIKNTFYLAGGTALSAFYLTHRFSEDLDFFTDSEQSMPSIEYLSGFINNLPGVKALDFQRLFDRRIFVAAFEDNEPIKLEFTSYPFKSLQERPIVGGIRIDSAINIITGKFFAMADRFEPKDYVDIFFFILKYDSDLLTLIKKTEERFQVRALEFVIPEKMLQAASIKANELPKMLKPLDLDGLKVFFLKQASILIKRRA